MAARSNAIGELTRFRLQTRHGCLLNESVPVPVRYGLSDIDLLATTSNLKSVRLPNGVSVGPRLVVETKDEHDWEASGREFAESLKQDLDKIGDAPCAPRGTKGMKFTMLREEHYETARERFSTDDFDRLFVVHAIRLDLLEEKTDALVEKRIHFLGVCELVADIHGWYVQVPRKAGLRHSLVGDLWHLLVGYCQCTPPGPEAP